MFKIRFGIHYTLIIFWEGQFHLACVLCVNGVSLCFLGPESHCQIIIHKNTTRTQMEMRKGGGRVRQRLTSANYKMTNTKSSSTCDHGVPQRRRDGERKKRSSTCSFITFVKKILTRLRHEDLFCFCFFTKKNINVSKTTKKKKSNKKCFL